MKPNNISTQKFILKYGLILGIIGGIYFYIRFATDNVYTINWFFSSIDLVLYISPVYPIYLYKSNNKGFLKLGEALKIGMGISLITTSILITLNIILIEIIQSEYIIQNLNDTREEILLNNPNMSPEDIKEIRISNKISSTLWFFIFNLMFGFVVSLISGAIMRRKKRIIEKYEK